MCVCTWRLLSASRGTVTRRFLWRLLLNNKTNARVSSGDSESRPEESCPREVLIFSSLRQWPLAHFKETIIMNISHDFVQRFERVKEDFKTSMFRDLCRQVDAWFAPLLAELKASVVVEGGVSPGPQSLVDVDTSRDDASSHFSLTTSLLDHQSTENGLTINSNNHLLVGSDPFWGSGGVVSDVVVPSTIDRDSAEELSAGVDSIIASSTPVNIIESTSSSLTVAGTVTNIKEELNSDHEETMDDHESGEFFGEDEGSINCDCSDCRSEEEEELEGELFSSKKVKLERQLSDEIVFDGSPPPGTSFFEISSSSHHESASAPSPPAHSLVKTSLDKMHFCNNSTCHASFRKRCQLVAHQRSHWSIRFRCQICKSDFASRSNIYRHLRSAHLPFEQQGQVDGEQDLKHLIEEITSAAKNSSTSTSVATSLEPPGSASLGSSGSSSSSSGSNTQKCYRCKWPLCDYTGEHSGNGRSFFTNVFPQDDITNFRLRISLNLLKPRVVTSSQLKPFVTKFQTIF